MSKWVMVKLGDYIQQVRGVSYKPEDITEAFAKNSIGILRANNIQDDGLNFKDLVYVKTEKVSSIQKIRKGDIVVCGSSGSKHLVGKASIAKEDYNVSFGAFCKVIRTEKICHHYLGQYFQSSFYRNRISELSGGANINNIRNEHIDCLEIPFPPLDEQKRIAEELDKISGLIAKRKSQLEKLELLVKAKFVEMFGDPVTNPMEWKKGCLSEVSSFLTSGSRGWSSFFSASGEMFLTIKNVKNNKILTSNMQYVNAPKGKEAERTKVQIYDLLISITADLGRTGVVDKSIAEYGAYINQHLSLIRLNMKKANPYYISYFLETPAGKKQFESKNQSAVKAGLNFEAIKSLLVLYPPLDLQNQFADYVAKVEQTKTKLQQGLGQLETLYKARMQEYFE